MKFKKRPFYIRLQHPSIHKPIQVVETPNTFQLNQYTPQPADPTEMLSLQSPPPMLQKSI